jgi:hypothetical protein
MTYTYRLTNDSEGVTATCAEMSASATGATSTEAVAALRDAICERLTHVEAVAPPDSVPVPSFELVLARESSFESSSDPQGPGDSPAAERAGSR